MSIVTLESTGGGPHANDVLLGDADHMAWLRSELDRPVDSVHNNFTNALGPGVSPMQAAIDMAREEGREELRILDVGGGTGHTLRTLVDMVVLHTDLSRPQVKGTVLNNNDFSEQSVSARTRRAIANDSIEYLIGNAQAMPFDNVPENGYDVVYAYELMLHLKRPEDLAKRLTRVARPAGHILFNALGSQSPLIDTALGSVAGPWEAMSATIGCPDAMGKAQTRTFYHLVKPGQVS
jgi:ubiquinone/menaquinone biosynthesis C-methylase UbiE